jgi:hypothetical protein
MRFCPYGSQLENVPNVVVDGRGNDATVLELSHWPGTTTPPELKGDTSTEAVINFLRSPRKAEYLGNAELVSNNHYDIDGLVSIWAVLNPEEALERADLLIAIGECGDFERWSGEEATKITCALNALEENPSLLSDIPEGASYLDRSGHLYEKMLPLLPDLLRTVEAFEEHWRAEYELICQGREAFARGETTVQEVPDVELAVFHIAQPVHTIALYEQTACTRVAITSDDQRHEARYRYESWVELQSRRPLPRIGLQPFADMLQTFEGNDGDWIAGDVQDFAASLRLRSPEGEPAPSSITPGLFARLLASYLRDNAENAALRWSPYG